MNSTLISVRFSAPAPYTQQKIRARSEWPGPGVLRKSPLFGNHLAATRQIAEGEVIYEQEPILQFPDFGTTSDHENEIKHICLNCYETVGSAQKCETCYWPLCPKPNCQNAAASVHCSSGECRLLAEQEIKENGTALGYMAIEMLRCLLLRNSEPDKWKKLLDLEPHLLARKTDMKAVHDLKFVVDFIRNKCGLLEFDEELIARMMGVIAINKFGVHQFIRNKSASYLYDQLSFLLHDCNPNSVKEFVERKPGGAVALRILARRQIEPGEPITIDYINQKNFAVSQLPTLSLKQRQEALKEQFYFDCRCQRCLQEMNGDRNFY